MATEELKYYGAPATVYGTPSLDAVSSQLLMLDKCEQITPIDRSVTREIAAKIIARTEATLAFHAGWANNPIPDGTICEMPDGSIVTLKAAPTNTYVTKDEARDYIEWISDATMATTRRTRCSKVRSTPGS